MPNVEELNDLHLDSIPNPEEGILDTLLRIVDTHPLLTFLFFASIIYLILNEINPYKIKK